MIWLLMADEVQTGVCRSGKFWGHQIRITIYVSICASICLSIYLYVYLSIYIYIYIYRVSPKLYNFYK